MVIPSLYHGYTMVIPWLSHRYIMVISWLYHGYTFYNWVNEPTVWRKDVRSFLSWCSSHRRKILPLVFLESYFGIPQKRLNISNNDGQQGKTHLIHFFTSTYSDWWTSKLMSTRDSQTFHWENIPVIWGVWAVQVCRGHSHRQPSWEPETYWEGQASNGGHFNLVASWCNFEYDHWY